MGRIEEKKKEKREKIMQAAFELFTSKGFHDTSILNITMKAGTAKGTFYLYFKDKEDIRNQLISEQSSDLFRQAEQALTETDISDFEDKLIFISDYVLTQLEKDPRLMDFIAKNLGWGVFKSALIHPDAATNLDFLLVYQKMIDVAPHRFRNPEVLLFMLVELIGSTCHSVILYKEPMGLEEYKPYLYQAIRDLIQGQVIEE